MRDLRAWQTDVADWHDARWGRDSVERRVLKLVEEVGEVAEAIVKRAQPSHPRAELVDLGGELADVFLVLLTAADYAGIDLQQRVDEKFDGLLAALAERQR